MRYAGDNEDGYTIYSVSQNECMFKDCMGEGCKREPGYEVIDRDGYLSGFCCKRCADTVLGVIWRAKK